MTKLKRIGPRMIEAANYVRNHPNCCKCDVADSISPQSRMYGYNTVDRAIKARIIRVVQSKPVYQLQAD